MTVPHHLNTPTRVALATMMLAAGVGIWGAGPSAAAAGVKLEYMCSLSQGPAQAMTAELTWNTPASVLVGQNTPVVPINATATMGPFVTQILGLVGATTVEGSVDTTGVVAAPDGNISVTRPLTVPRTAVPTSGSITVAATGSTPVLVFHRAGRATITVGSGFGVHLTPRDAAGNAIFGQVDASCTLNPGQNNFLASFDITAPKTTTVPAGGGPVKPTTATIVRPTIPPAPAPDPITTGPVPTATSAVVDPGVPTTTGTTTATHDLAAIATATTHRQAANPLLVSGAMLAVVAAAGIVGYVWRTRRRGRHGN